MEVTRVYVYLFIHLFVTLTGTKNEDRTATSTILRWNLLRRKKMQAEYHVRNGVIEQSLKWTTITTANQNVSHIPVTRSIYRQ